MPYLLPFGPGGIAPAAVEPETRTIHLSVLPELDPETVASQTS